MRNEYLKDRAMRKDMRNPYGSRGGYVSSRRSRGRDRSMDYGHDYPERDGRYDSRYDERRMDYRYDRNMEYPREHSRPMDYEIYGVGGMRPMYDYRGRMSQRDYGYDYASEDMEKEWQEDLEEWCKKLKKHDIFNMPKEQIIQKARDMGVKFKDYDELEFMTTYYMMISDYKNVSNDPHFYLVLAKQFLEDDDIAMKGSEKLCAYLYEIVKGGEE